MTPGSLAMLLAVLLTSPAWILLSHVVLARLFPGRVPQVVAIGAGLMGALPTVFLVATLAGLPPSALLRLPVVAAYVVLVYGCVAYAYFHLFNMSETARRIRILRELHAAGSLTAAEISALYTGTAVLDARFDRLVAPGPLETRGGRFVRAGRLLYLAAGLVRAWRLVLGLERR
jgi:hypothetical protein